MIPAWRDEAACIGMDTETFFDSDRSKGRGGRRDLMSDTTVSVAPDLDDPDWEDVEHDTQTLDCQGGEHGECFLPDHCQCWCHNLEETR